MRRAQLHAFKEIGGEFVFWQFHTDFGAAWAKRVCCRLDTVQTVPHHAAQAINGKAKRLPLWRQLEDKLLFVVGQIVLDARHFGVARQSIFQSLGCRLEALGACSVKLHVQGIAPGPRAPPSEADGFGQRVLFHAFLKLADEGEAGVRSQVGINQLYSNATQLIGLFGVGTCQTITRVPANLRHHVVQRIAAMAFFVLVAQFFGCALQLSHHLKRVFACGARRHGKIASDAAALGRVEEPPLHVALHEKGDLRGENGNHAGHDGISQADHPRHERPEQDLAYPDEPAVHHAAWGVVPVPLVRMAQGMGHVVRQDEEALHQ